MPRRSTADQEFGSDSFLDVVANIVGILIILIVVAGVRVSRAPVRSSVEVPPSASPDVSESIPAAEFPPDPESPPIDAPLPTGLEPTPPILAEAVAEPVPLFGDPESSPVAPPPRELPPLPVFEPIAPAREPRQLAERTRELEAAARMLTEQIAAERQRLTRMEERRRQLTSAGEAASEALSVQAATIRRHRLNTAVGEQAINDLETEIASLKRKLDEQSRVTTETKTLTHRLPPIGRLVTGDELHFRLAGNRVSYVPVMELAEQVKAELERRKEQLMNRPFHQGTIGPIDGYLMDYMLQRESLSLVEEMRIGRAAVRIGLSGWVISPTAEMVPETADEALRADSKFVDRLRQANPSSTITFWVYPDSFEIHGRLKSYIHELGLWVASRPLPDGVPIAGSPQGSKSLAQ